MRLLFDHNLSPRLIKRLVDILPNSTHVLFVGLDQATDLEVWQYAQTHAYTIVTKDIDFNDLSVMLGAPPKVIWLRIGNSTTRAIEDLLRNHQTAISHFVADPKANLLSLVGR